MLLENKYAIVTGATRGIGRQIALTLAKNGADLIVTGTNDKLLQQLAEEIQSLGQKCFVNIGNIADPAAAKALAVNVEKNFPQIDILVNNAGINMRKPTLDMLDDEWQKIIDVNLNGTFYTCKAILPYMVKQEHGVIVNVSSSTAKTPHRNATPAYGASKAGINYLTQHLALEMAKYNIRVNAVCPGPIETDMSKQWTTEYRKKLLERIPLKKLGQPADVANMVLFLASDMAVFITGESININGGIYMN
ncbi:SDR family NAD(P)-dependent oxidoreductase [Pectinatus brassicae]|uniref:3-oxoacyl-[acyl-carrier protein] reductase n=1 Tax=Pectinatus brassicae TaxID=862415 RepID=A0A840UJ02_9FIRM|nr:SDR family NAD(P)-dependent oxidoreductase [Pectinatus brassicae]MBB5336959.1 3-oxoacyl-[acyl-carrier protein] reductase [Pectinatus brassicae]